MARTEARLLTEIWSDGDFRALTRAQQGMYMFLLSQPDLAHDGVIALRERRWAQTADDLTRAQVADDLQALHDARFVVVDWDEEEVCVRSLIRCDRIFKQPNVMRAAIDHVPLVHSRAILAALLAEMERIASENPGLTEHQAAALAEMTQALAGRLKPKREKGSAKGSAKGLADPTPGTPGERGSSTAVSSSSPSPVPRAVPPSAGDAAAPAAPRGELAVVPDAGPEPRTAQQIVGWWIDQCQQRPPRNVVGQMAKQIGNLVDEGINPLHIRQGIAEWITRDVHPSVLPSLVNSAMNQRQRTAPARQPATERKFAAGMQVVAALRAREAGATA